MLLFVAQNKEFVTLVSTVVLAFIGYFAKYFNDLSIARRRDRLDRVNSQLKSLYGPLFALAEATGAEWKEFRKRHRPGMPYFNKSRPPNDLDLEVWRLWIKAVFMPLNRRMAEIIVANGDLLDDDMPTEFLDLVAHVAGYEVVLNRWDEKDFSEHTAPTNFPINLEKVVKAEYDRLRLVQRHLLAHHSDTSSHHE